MVLSYLAFATIFFQEGAEPGVWHLPAGILLFALGSVLLVIGTLLRRGLSVKQATVNSHTYRRRPQSVSVDANRRSVEGVRSTSTSRTRANAV
jgi:hypothetical protein